jgi:hypothetical protein
MHKHGLHRPAGYSSTFVRISAWSSAAGVQTYPENAPDTLLIGLIGGEVLVLDVVSAPTGSNGARIVSWLGRRGPSLPSNGCALFEANERRV